MLIYFLKISLDDYIVNFPDFSNEINFELAFSNVREHGKRFYTPP